MWKALSNLWLRKGTGACKRMHGQRGEFKPLPQDRKELQKQYGTMIQQLSKR